MYELRDNSEHSNSNKENPKIKMIKYIKKKQGKTMGSTFLALFSTLF